jgi:hypothetical protein
MAITKPSEYRRKYVELCHYRWEFLRRNPSYIRDYTRHVKDHPNPLAERDPLTSFFA